MALRLLYYRYGTSGCPFCHSSHARSNTDARQLKCRPQYCTLLTLPAERREAGGLPLFQVKDVSLVSPVTALPLLSATGTRFQRSPPLTPGSQKIDVWGDDRCGTSLTLIGGTPGGGATLACIAPPHQVSRATRTRVWWGEEAGRCNVAWHATNDYMECRRALRWRTTSRLWSAPPPGSVVYKLVASWACRGGKVCGTARGRQ